jgi:transposase
LSWLNKKQRQTNRSQEYIYEKVSVAGDPQRKELTVKQVSDHEKMSEGVEEVCVDMWGGFPKVIREVFPNAKTVVDRFHVQKLVNKALNKIRLALKLKGLKNRYLLMNNQANLTNEDREELELLLKSSPR